MKLSAKLKGVLWSGFIAAFTIWKFKGGCESAPENFIGEPLFFIIVVIINLSFSLTPDINRDIY